MILLWKLDHIKSLSLRKRGWETLVYRVADLCGGQARVVAPDELSDHAVAAAAVASPSSDYTRRMQCTTVASRGSYGAAIGEEAGDSRDVQVSHARKPPSPRRRVARV